MNVPYTPDGWCLVCFRSPEDDLLYHKVFAGWYGNFVRGHSWRLNSGIKSCSIEDGFYMIHGFSGSTYEVDMDTYGAYPSYCVGILQQLIEKGCRFLQPEEAKEYLDKLVERHNNTH